MVAAYRDRRDRLAELLSRTGQLLATPRGAFYAMVDVSGAGADSRPFARRLLEWRRNRARNDVRTEWPAHRPTVARVIYFVD